MVNLVKPIIRWTIGNVHPAGFKVLSHSVKLIKSIYGSDFDLFICYNNLDTNRINLLKNLGVPLVEQRHTGEILVEPRDVAWKLYPPRLNLRTHEIFIDNDLVLFKNLKIINWFLEQKNSFIACEGVAHFFGSQDRYIPENVKINSGLFGIPPYFDLAQAVNTYQNLPWNNRYDEQGVVANILIHNDYKLVSLNEVSICSKNFIPATHGLHFCSINKGYTDSWHKYSAIRLF